MKEYKNKDTLVKRVNMAFSEEEAEIYDDRHPEILIEEVDRWKEFGHFVARTFGDKKITILDIGTGTGFVPSIILPLVGEGNRFICTDISARMLEIAREKLSKSRYQTEIIYKVGDIESLHFGDGSIDVITINSVLHHLPRPHRFLQRVDGVLKEDGVVMIAHEPNKLFFKNRLLRSTYVLLERLNKYTKIENYRRKIMKIFGKEDSQNTHRSLFERANLRLLNDKVIDEPLNSDEIEQLVDVCSPTASFKMDREKGFDPDQIVKGHFPNYKRIKVITYSHLGKIIPRNVFLRKLNSIFEKRYPYEGSLFSLLLQKPG